MKKVAKNNAPTPESVWAFMQESNRYLKKLHAETERILNEKFAETDRQQKETDRKIDKYQENYERRMKNMEKLTGAWSFNHGCFAEEYFFNSLAEGQENFFGETFNKIS
jgi:protease II